LEHSPLDHHATRFRYHDGERNPKLLVLVMVLAQGVEP